MRQLVKYHSRLFFVSIYFLLVVFPLVVSAAQSVTLQWDPNGATPDGYHLYKRMGNQTYDYNNPHNSSLINGTTYTVNGLTEGETYYFVVRSVLGNEVSADSNEAAYTVPGSNPDSDNDGYNDSVDAFPNDSSEWQDTDGDGIGNQTDQDDDGDGLPDTWENEYGLDPLDSADALEDLDGDGVSNQDEYKDGSDPSDIPGNTAPDQPTLVEPADGAEQVDLMPTLMTGRYTDVDGHAHIRTVYQIATSTDWASDLVFECEFSKQLTSTTLGDLILDPETTYYWRVRFYDEHNGRSAWSEASIFTTIDNATAGFQDDDGDGILNDQEVAQEDVDPGLGDTSNMIVVGTSDDTNPQLSVLLSGNADIMTIRSVDSDSVEVGSVENRPEVLTGVISFKVALLDGSVSADITVNLLTPAPEDAIWYKYSSENGWTPYPHVTFSDDRKSVTIHLVDGGIGDDDGVQNGVIVDPSGLGYRSTDTGATLGDNESSTTGSSGGCFIAAPLNDLAAVNGGLAHLVIAGLMGLVALMCVGYRK